MPRAPAPSTALARLDLTPPPSRLREAELRLRDVIAELDALDAQLEADARALEDFTAVYEAALGEASAETDAWERVLRRLRALQDELARLTRVVAAAGDAAEPSATPRKRRRRAATPAARVGLPTDVDMDGDGDADAADADAGDVDGDAAAAVPEDEAALLKRLYRKLVRVLHPDLASSPEEAERLSALMAQVNHAYATDDRALLELMAARVGTGEALDGVTEDERVAHVERRTRTLATAARSLREQGERLRTSATGRLYAEARRREAEGRDFLAEQQAELEVEARSLAGDVRARRESLERAARALTQALSKQERSQRMSSSLTGGGGGRRLKVFDPVLESALVRRGAERLERARATDAARALARELEDAQARGELAPLWLTLMAAFAETAGRPPPGLASEAAWEERWEALRAAHPEAGAPDYARALARLPRHLELGLRLQKGEVRFGVQLRSAELLAAVPLALERAEVAEAGRSVLARVGPREGCRGCGHDGYLVHLLRTRGLDERHGLACAACGRVAKSYWLFAKADGQEALLPHALKLGLVTEVAVRFAGAGVAFQMLPAERDALTAGALRQRFAELLLAPYGVEGAAEHLEVLRKGTPLPDAAPAAGSGVLTLRLRPEAGQADADVLALLRARIERRFRPDPK